MLDKTIEINYNIQKSDDRRGKNRRRIMKKKLLLITLLFTVLCISLSACTLVYPGTYKFESMKYTSPLGGTTEYKIGDSFLGTEITKESVVLELKSDNTCEITVSLGSLLSYSTTGTWEVNAEDSSKVDIKTSVVTTTSEFNLGKLIYTDGGFVFTLTRF